MQKLVEVNNIEYYHFVNNLNTKYLSFQANMVSSKKQLVIKILKQLEINDEEGDTTSTLIAKKVYCHSKRSPINYEKCKYFITKEVENEQPSTN